MGTEEKEYPSMQPVIVVDGEVGRITSHTDSGYPMIEWSEGPEEFYVFDSAETAGEEAREHYADMAEHDPEELISLLGPDTLVSWALGRAAGPGTTLVSSLAEWLDLSLAHPAEFFAAYDHAERTLRAPDEAALARAWDIDMSEWAETPLPKSWRDVDEEDWPQWVTDLDANGFDPDEYEPGDLMAANEEALRALLGDEITDGMLDGGAVAYRH